MITQDDVFKIGVFGKPHGIKGELSLMTDSDVFDDTEEPYIVCDMDGILVPFFIEEYRYKSDSVILVKLENVDDERSAREFVNKEVFYPLEMVDEEDLLDNMSWDNLKGFNVIDDHKGELGIIRDIDDSTINVLIGIDYKGKELLLPAVDDFIKSVDYENKVLKVDIPAELFDL